MEKELGFFVNIKSLRMTGMYEPEQVIFFKHYFQVCSIKVWLNGEERRVKALLDDTTGTLRIKGLVGTFPHSDLVWPASVTMDSQSEVEIRWGPHDYVIGGLDIERLAFAEPTPVTSISSAARHQQGSA